MRKSDHPGRYVPVTPAGTPLVELEAATEDEAWNNLMRDASHMPYKTREGFEARGYSVEFWPTDL